MKLKSGATILMLMGDTVLARYGNQFVTWKIDGEGNAYWGHYFNANQFNKAVNDFHSRVEHVTIEAV
jgi:hypothetical protein